MPDIPPLPDGTILMVEVGSTAHGTGLPHGEDHDEMVVTVESPAQVLGLTESGLTTTMYRTQPQGVRSGPGDIDRTVYSLRRFLRLAASGNPSILMAFWAPVLHATDEGRELRGLGEKFVSRHVIPRYRGYMQSQAERLLGLRGGRHRGVGAVAVSERNWSTSSAMTPSTPCTVPDSDSSVWSYSRPGISTCRYMVTLRTGFGQYEEARSHSTRGGIVCFNSTPS